MEVRLKPGDRIRDYTVIEVVGIGGQAAAYKASGDDGRIVVLKQSLSRLDAESAKRLERLRGLIGARLPHVAEVFDVFVHDGFHYLVCAWVEGESLEARLARDNILSEPDASSLGVCVLEGLKGLHALSIVHRDVKPGNIVLGSGEDGSLAATLIDLGIALDTKATRLTVRGMLGSCLYTAPEQFLGAEVSLDGRADLYSLGVTLFEALAGTTPFRSRTTRSLTREVCSPERRRLNDVAPHVSEAMCDFVNQLIRANPDERFATAEEARQALLHLTAASRPSVEMPSGTPATSKRMMESGRLEAESAKVIRGAGAEALGCGHAVEVLRGPFAGKIISIPAKGITLGRAQVNPDDHKISRFHTRVTPRRGGLACRDLHSLNHLLFKSLRRRFVRLNPGGVLTLGATPIRYVTTEKGDLTP